VVILSDTSVIVLVELINGTSVVVLLCGASPSCLSVVLLLRYFSVVLLGVTSVVVLLCGTSVWYFPVILLLLYLWNLSMVPLLSYFSVVLLRLAYQWYFC
jgi:hypothetical protein